jgi:hypothetical protein
VVTDVPGHAPEAQISDPSHQRDAVPVRDLVAASSADRHVVIDAAHAQHGDHCITVSGC